MAEYVTWQLYSWSGWSSWSKTNPILLSNLQELNLPLSATAWSEEDLKDPKKLYEMTVLLNAQREMADKILDAQWDTKWRQEKVVTLRIVMIHTNTLENLGLDGGLQFKISK